MPYLRAFSTLGCAERNLSQIAALVRQFSLAAAELRGVGGILDLPAYFEKTYDTPASLVTEVRRLGLRVTALDTSFKLADATEADRAELLRYVPWAEALGVRWLRVFDGGSPEDEAMSSRALATLLWWRRERRMNGWTCDLMVETHDALFTAERINRFTSAAGGVAILWDSHHTWKRGKEDPVTTWREIFSNVVHIHVKDSVSRPSEKHPFTYVLPGDGEFPAVGLFAALRVDGYAGIVSLEWERLWHPYLAPVEDALTAASQRDWW
jgi:sugar phosphate isomerase/epimerase